MSYLTGPVIQQPPDDEEVFDSVCESPNMAPVATPSIFADLHLDSETADARVSASKLPQARSSSFVDERVEFVSEAESKLKAKLMAMFVRYRIELQAHAERHQTELSEELDKAVAAISTNIRATELTTSVRSSYSNAMSRQLSRHTKRMSTWAVDTVQSVTSRVHSVTTSFEDVPCPCCPQWERRRLAKLRDKMFAEGSHAGSMLLKHVHHYTRVDGLIGILILLNTVVMLISLEVDGQRAAAKLGLQEDDPSLERVQKWCEAAEHGFTLTFAFELFFRIAMERRKFCIDPWNVLDVFLVAASTFALYVLAPLQESHVGNLTFLRILRLSRVMRALRIARTMKLFDGLRLLVKSVFSCMCSLFWSLILLLALMTAGGLVLANLVSDHLADESQELETRLWIWKHYGTSGRALYTMFEVTQSGCWPNYARPLIDEVSFMYSIFFVIYVSFVLFAVLRVITAIFLAETMEGVKNDTEVMIRDADRKKKHYLTKLTDAFKAVDASGDGKLTYSEFSTIISDPTIRTYMGALDLHVDEGLTLFKLLDNGTDHITYEEFVKGVSRLKGQARSLDVIVAHRDIEAIGRKVDGLVALLSPEPSASRRE